VRRIVHRLALLFLVALCSRLAFALSETYEGQLISRGNETPISIVLQIEETGGFLTGRVRTSHPLKGDASIDAGRNVAGFCNLSVPLSGSVMLRLYGNCSSLTFEGNYTIYYAGSRNVTRGTFRLTKKIVESSKAGSGLDGADIAASAVVACVKANTRCLAACPRGDTNVEYLCANHCRTKMQACKGKASKVESDPQ
jgi:hypothetical protein